MKYILNELSAVMLKIWFKRVDIDETWNQTFEITRET